LIAAVSAGTDNALGLEAAVIDGRVIAALEDAE